MTTPEVQEAKPEMYKGLSPEDAHAFADLHRIGPFGELLRVAEIQILSGMLHIDGYESKRMWEGRWRRETNQFKKERIERYGPDQGKNIPLDQLSSLLTDIIVNMRVCTHEEREKTGESIPMGSFTARPERCTTCGTYFGDD